MDEPMDPTFVLPRQQGSDKMTSLFFLLMAFFTLELPIVLSIIDCESREIEQTR